MDTLLALVRSPGTLIFGGSEVSLAWLRTRRWGLLLLFGMLPFAAFLFMLCASWAGTFGGPAQVLESYWTLIDERVDSQAEGKLVEDSLAGKPLDSYTEMLLERVFLEDQSNNRATYLVASQLGAQGRIGQARAMMRSIAPEASRGFLPAHAWLAADRITRVGVENNAQLNTLLHDFKQASQWEGISPILLARYASLLGQQDRMIEALTILRKAAEQEPNLWISVAAAAKKSGLKQQFEESAERVRQDTQPKVDARTATAEEYARLATVDLLEEDYGEARKTVELGLRTAGDNPQLRRLLSEAYRLEYLALSDFDARTFSLDFLDAALKADGSNEKVTEEVAKLVALGEEASPELRRMLEEKLASGKATTLTHFLLANRDLVDGELESAIAHLEVAVRQSPNWPMLLNNLGLSLARRQNVTPEDLQRAIEYLQRSIQLGGPNPEMLDSLGEVMMLAGKPIEAVQLLEAAIGRDADRIGTRKKLVQAYKAAGLLDMAEVQERFIEKAQAADSTSNESQPNESTPESSASRESSDGTPEQ